MNSQNLSPFLLYKGPLEWGLISVIVYLWPHSLVHQSPWENNLHLTNMDTKSQVMEARTWIGELLVRILGEEQEVTMVMEVDQAERLLDRHYELKIEVEECSEACREIVEELVEEGWQVDVEVAEAARMMDSSMDDLNQLWEERRALYEQCYELQRFLLEADEQDELIIKLEEVVRNPVTLDDSGITDDTSFDSGLDTSSDLVAVQATLFEWATG